MAASADRECIGSRPVRKRHFSLCSLRQHLSCRATSELVKEERSNVLSTAEPVDCTPSASALAGGPVGESSEAPLSAEAAPRVGEVASPSAGGPAWDTKEAVLSEAAASASSSQAFPQEVCSSSNSSLSHRAQGASSHSRACRLYLLSLCLGCRPCGRNKQSPSHCSSSSTRRSDFSRIGTPRSLRSDAASHSHSTITRSRREAP